MELKIVVDKNFIMKDFLSDMLTRIRNGQRAGLDAVYLHSHTPKMCKVVLKLLVEEGYIRGFSEYDSNKLINNKIKVFLKYKNNGAPVIEGLFRVSTPGRRIYVSTKILWKPKTNIGLFIFSTPQGIMTDRDARLLNLGGEVLCGIY